ncbi:hypothetical protein DPMN_145401 [Dreissena polymorpha]|uniref:Uncharacterized protein n=1 Tax=Dreissena polymorpha TaxID=45954 RepID=A0A9D4F5X8_DREPO|nr:hypothetical protein DPMN_145401 [Dreissena polymorpha]
MGILSVVRPYLKQLSTGVALLLMVVYVMSGRQMSLYFTPEAERLVRKIQLHHAYAGGQADPVILAGNCGHNPRAEFCDRDKLVYAMAGGHSKDMALFPDPGLYSRGPRISTRHVRVFSKQLGRPKYPI